MIASSSLPVSKRQKQRGTIFAIAKEVTASYYDQTTLLINS